MEPEINPELPLAAVLFVALAFAGKAVGDLVADSGAAESAARNALVIEDLRLSMNAPSPPTSAAAQAPAAINLPMGHLPIGWLADFFVAYVGLGAGVDAAVGKEFEGTEFGGRELLGSPQSNDS